MKQYQLLYDKQKRRISNINAGRPLEWEKESLLTNHASVSSFVQLWLWGSRFEEGFAVINSQLNLNSNSYDLVVWYGLRNFDMMSLISCHWLEIVKINQSQLLQ